MPKKTKPAVQVVDSAVELEVSTTVITELEAKVAELEAKSVPSAIQKKKKTLASYRTYLNNPSRYARSKEISIAELRSLMSDGLTLDNADNMLEAMNIKKWSAKCEKLEAEIAELAN